MDSPAVCAHSQTMRHLPAALTLAVVISPLPALAEDGWPGRYTLAEGPYDTVAGFFMSARGQLPTLNASVEVEATRPGEEKDEIVRLELTVTELDGRRAARLEVKPLPSEPIEQSPSSPRDR